MSFLTSVILYNSKINHNGLFNCNFGGSGASRDSTMGASSNLATVKFTYDNCTYMRKDKTITVNENADVLDAAGVNYCRYMNPDFNNTMYFYAFVKKIEYVAPQTSRLYIETDCYMTYFDKINWENQYVERMNLNIPYNTHFDQHIPNGGGYATDFLSDGAYTAPRCFYSSPIPTGFVFNPYDGTNDNGWIIMNMSKDCFVNDNLPGSGSISPVVSGLPQGSYWIAVEPTDLWLFTTIINGPQDTPTTRTDGIFTLQDVLSIYYIPRDCITVDDQNPWFVIEAGAGAQCPYFSFTIPDAWQGGTLYGIDIPGGARVMTNNYQPKNPVLLRYPYNFYKITDRLGHEWIFKPEMFKWAGGEAISIKYRKYFSIGDTVSIGIKITNYMNAECQEDMCIFQTFPQIGAMSDSFQQYLALNKNSLQNQYRWMGYDLAMGITKSSMNVATGYANQNSSSLINGLTGIWDSAINYERKMDTMNAKFEDMKSYPASTVCSGNGNLNMLMGNTGLFLERWSIDAAAAQCIDELYDAAGYPINQIINSDPTVLKEKYVYIKTKNCHITGVIPEQDRLKIDSLFNSGITIWHNPANYGLYDLSGNNPNA